MKLSPIKTNTDPSDTRTLVERVEMNLIRYFIDAKVQPGDAVPTEMELTESLGVSRTVVREAMMRLRTIGLIDSRKHRGAVIGNPDLLLMLEKTMHPHMMDHETLKDIFEIRLALEIGMADLIFERISRRDIDVLKRIVEDEPEFADSYLFEISHEVRFHSKLYEISGNRTLQRFQGMLLPAFQYVYDSGLLMKDVQPRKFVSHKGLIHVLEHGNPEMFRNAMRNHLENHFLRLFADS